MDFQRVFLFLIFTFSIYILWDGWEKQQTPPVEVVNTHTQSVPVASAKLGKETVKTLGSTDVITSPLEQRTGKSIKVKTDFLNVEISTLGGDITHVDLLKHFSTEDKTKPFVIFHQDKDTKYVAQSGLLGKNLPTHNTEFTTNSFNYELGKDSESVEVRLIANNQHGIKVEKIYTFNKSSYLIDVKYVIHNSTKELIDSSAYFQLVRDNVSPAGSSMFIPTFTGPATYTDKEKFVKIDFDSIDKNNSNTPAVSDNGWVGMLQHYFVSAWVPQTKSQREFYARKLDDKLYSVGFILPVGVIQPGASGELASPLYVGPAQSKLDSVAEGLGLTVDYGFLTILAKPIFWTLTEIHGLVQNWGLAIILLTILIKLIFFPLSAASYRSMAKMKLVAPKLAKIKEQHSGDRERLNRAMMDLYKTEKINPLGGCLPVLIQIPVFIALYWSILASVEMRYAPFFGWITDLSKSDPYFILPIVMGISMMIQTKLNPTPPDPLQAKLMQIMPIAFSVVFFFFPAGLVLYSIVNNVLSIAQQWYITKTIEVEAKGVAKV